MSGFRKIVLAFDSFKGCLSAADACHSAALAIASVLPEASIMEIPLSDGGEGLVNSILLTDTSNSLNKVSVVAHGPLMEPLSASYAISSNGETAFMEMAATSGLPLVPIEKRNPMVTTTYGVGDMIFDAVERGCRKIIIGIGGSATCDAGEGMIRALQQHKILDDKFRRNPDFSNVSITVACDVNNPLFGPKGAAYVFAPQKGANPDEVAVLDERLRQFDLLTQHRGLADSSLAYKPGTGAAGGLGYGLIAYLQAELKSGIEIMLDQVGFDEKIKNADLIITGEGKSDRQTLMGKVPYGVLQRTKLAGVTPVWLLSGAIEDTDSCLSREFNLIRSINEGDDEPLELLMRPDIAQRNLRNTLCHLLSE